MTQDFAPMLTKVKAGQWALADIDWDAPGAELITDAQRPKLRAFMCDLVWIEHIGARGFAAMARKAPDDNLAEIYEYFHAEERRHANAELALMRRWGMLEDDETPEPNVNVRMAIEWLERYADEQSLSVLGTVIPMLEVALDGALVKFLLEEVADPVCHQVFAKINSDESRHLATDFQVLDMLGAGPIRKVIIESIGGTIRPSLLIGLLMYIPLLNKMRDNIVAMGLSETRLYQAVRRYESVGERSANTRRLPLYQLIKQQGRMVIDRGHPYHLVADFMVKATGLIPKRVFGAAPTWVRELTHEPISA